MLLMRETTHSNYVPENLEEFSIIEFELYDKIPYNEEKPNEEQVFFCLGHYFPTYDCFNSLLKLFLLLC